MRFHNGHHLGAYGSNSVTGAFASNALGGATAFGDFSTATGRRVKALGYISTATQFHQVAFGTGAITAYAMRGLPSIAGAGSDLFVTVDATGRLRVATWLRQSSARPCATPAHRWPIFRPCWAVSRARSGRRRVLNPYRVHTHAGTPCCMKEGSFQKSWPA